jgi:hypothetical protein
MLQKGTARWTYDPTVDAWTIFLDERGSPPYRNNIQVEVTLDIDDEGRLACIEILGRSAKNPLVLPPKE